MEEEPLLQLDLYSVILQEGKNCSNLSYTLFGDIAEDNYIVQMNKSKLPFQRSNYYVHLSLESLWCVLESNGNSN